jgi:hypothetical protein
MSGGTRSPAPRLIAAFFAALRHEAVFIDASKTSLHQGGAFFIFL